MSDIFHRGESEAGTYTEWRIHGVPSEGDEPYSFVWSDLLNEHLTKGDAQTAARDFVQMIKEAPYKWRYREPWADGPHLSRRTVTISEWEGTA